MDQDIEKLTVDEILKIDYHEGIVEGIPTGMYPQTIPFKGCSEFSSLLTLIMDNKLICMGKGYYTPSLTVPSSNPGFDTPLDSEIKTMYYPIANLEDFALASALSDQSIRSNSPIQAYGRKVDDVFYMQCLKIGDNGFRFIKYVHPDECF